MNLSLSFKFDSKVAKILSFARFALNFEKSESDSTQNSNILSELVSLGSMSSNLPNTGLNDPKRPHVGRLLAFCFGIGALHLVVWFRQPLNIRHAHLKFGSMII